jgi:hypothetical protein
MAKMNETDDRNLLKAIRMALRKRGKISNSPDKLLKWIKDLNSGVLKGVEQAVRIKYQQHNLLTHQRFARVITKIGFYVHIGNCNGHK